jgi:hypothetical protein
MMSDLLTRDEQGNMSMRSGEDLITVVESSFLKSLPTSLSIPQELRDAVSTEKNAHSATALAVLSTMKELRLKYVDLELSPTEKEQFQELATDVEYLGEAAQEAYVVSVPVDLITIPDAQEINARSEEAHSRRNQPLCGQPVSSQRHNCTP